MWWGLVHFLFEVCVKCFMEKECWKWENMLLCVLNSYVLFIFFVPSVCCNSIFPSVTLYSLDKGVGAFVTALNASVKLCAGEVYWIWICLSKVQVLRPFWSPFAMLQVELWISAHFVYVFCDLSCLSVKMLMIVSLKKVKNGSRTIILMSALWCRRRD